MNRPRSNKSHAGEHTTAGPPLRFPASLRFDLPASFVLFLLAVPLSLGVAAATGAPLISGLIASVVGGVVAGLFGGAPLQVSGAATGVMVVTAGLVLDYGWAATAAITLAAGLVQIVLGVTKVARLALSLSPAVVHGMLAGIGISIALGQLVIVLGGHVHATTLANLAELPAELRGSHFGSVVVGAVAIAVMLMWRRIPRAALVPAPLAAVLAATATAIALRLDVSTVDLPDAPLTDVVLPRLPDGSVGGVALAVVTVALVASMESLLSAVAVDKLHDGPRADLDRELVAQGAANAVSGALGGLPVSGGIIRGSANVAAGARTRAATVLHGFWIVVFVVALGGLLELIPLAGLAGVLLVVGLRLVSRNRVRKLAQHGEITPYVGTVAGVLVFGLVEGVLIGMAIAVLRSLYRLTHSTVRVDEEPDGWRVSIRGSLVFLGVSRLVRELRRIPLGKRVVLELHIDFMDHAAFEAIDDWRGGYQRLGGQVDVDEVHDTWFRKAIGGKPGLRKTPPSPLPRWFAPWSHWQRTRPGDAADVVLPTQRGDTDPMIRGMHEFERNSAPLVRPFLAELAARGQRPQQLFITCADSRVVPNLITSSGPGDLFCVRNIGNLVPASGTEDSVGAAIEYAVDVLGVGTIAVCGHSHCGAMSALVNGGTRPGTALTSWLRHADPSLIRFHEPAGSHDLPVVERLSVANVAQQLDNLLTYPSVREAVNAGALRLVGMYFDISAARVYLVNPDRNALEPLRTPANH
ncbi:SulP family inorganic anion transporter [Umezawaea sp.]|uniref:SulP family inorganic anion transporter n=1 Tax=Umezawaea sp. TaxID=1955258 RepID=UPI002ED60329